MPNRSLEVNPPSDGQALFARDQAIADGLTDELAEGLIGTPHDRLDPSARRRPGDAAS